MPSKLNPYLQFDGTAAAAMEFYRDVFGGDLTMSTFGEFGQTDPAVAGQIMHAQLETPTGYTLMASDTAPGMPSSPMGGFGVSLSGDDEQELRGYFDALSQAGMVTLPLEQQMWGDMFGMVVDKFGVLWMVNIAAQQS